MKYGSVADRLTDGLMFKELLPQLTSVYVVRVIEPWRRTITMVREALVDL